MAASSAGRPGTASNRRSRCAAARAARRRRAAPARTSSACRSSAWASRYSTLPLGQRHLAAGALQGAPHALLQLADGMLSGGWKYARAAAREMPLLGHGDEIAQEARFEVHRPSPSSIFLDQSRQIKYLHRLIQPRTMQHPSAAQDRPMDAAMLAPPTAATPVPDSRGLNLFRADPYAAALSRLYLPAALRAPAAAPGPAGALAGRMDGPPTPTGIRPRCRCATAPGRRIPHRQAPGLRRAGAPGLQRIRPALSHRGGALWPQPGGGQVRAQPSVRAGRVRPVLPQQADSLRARCASSARRNSSTRCCRRSRAWTSTACARAPCS